MELKQLPRPIDSTEPRWLILDHLDLDPVAARCLSPAVASRHHALPVAATDRRVTVAMADPIDALALEAVASELAVDPYIVQADRLSNLRLLAELWREEGRESTRILVCARGRSQDDEVSSYAEYVGNLLNAGLHHLPEKATLDALVEEAKDDHQPVITGKLGGSRSTRWFSRSAERAATGRLAVSLLIAQGPRQPPRNVLLVIQGRASDHEATNWTPRLAGRSGASVTAFPVVPAVPAMYHGLARVERGLVELLKTDTARGRQMRQVARRLVDGQIEGTLRLRQGSPEWEIRREAVQGCDLLVIGAARQGGARQWLLDDLAVSLTRVVDRPILVAKLLEQQLAIKGELVAAAERGRPRNGTC